MSNNTPNIKGHDSERVSPFNFIINPYNDETYNIFSSNGQALLKQYVQYHQTGGSSSGWSRAKSGSKSRGVGGGGASRQSMAHVDLTKQSLSEEDAIAVLLTWMRNPKSHAPMIPDAEHIRSRNDIIYKYNFNPNNKNTVLWKPDGKYVFQSSTYDQTYADEGLPVPKYIGDFDLDEDEFDLSEWGEEERKTFTKCFPQGCDIVEFGGLPILIFCQLNDNEVPLLLLKNLVQSILAFANASYIQMDTNPNNYLISNNYKVSLIDFESIKTVPNADPLVIVKQHVNRVLNLPDYPDLKKYLSEHSKDGLEFLNHIGLIENIEDLKTHIKPTKTDHSEIA